MALIESIPNVSEGRRPEVVERFADVIRKTPGVRLLDYSSDPSHNRSVLTLVGDYEPLKQATLALFKEAAAAIDLRTHTGEHPRLGAVDVVPFVPIEGATMEDCVRLAKAVGAKIVVARGHEIGDLAIEDSEARRSDAPLIVDVAVHDIARVHDETDVCRRGPVCGLLDDKA